MQNFVNNYYPNPFNINQSKTEEVNNPCAYIHDLSLLEQKAFSGKNSKTS